MRATSALARAAMVVLLVGGIALRSQELVPTLRHLDERDNPRAELRDFRDTVYEPGHDLRDGNNPYDPEPYLKRHPGHQELDLYGPHLFLVALPASMLPVAVAQALWLLAMAAAVVTLAWLCWLLAGRHPDAWVVGGTTGALLATNPVQQGVLTGNISLVIVAACAAAIHWSARRPMLAAACVAVVLVKPQFGLPLALLIALGLRRPKPAVAGIAGAAALSIVPGILLLDAAGGIRNFLDAVGRNLDHSTELYGDVAGRASVMRSDLWGAIGKLADVNPTTATQLLTFVAVTAIAIAVLWVTSPRFRRESTHRTGVVLVIAAILLGLPHFSYDLPLLGVAFVVAVFGPDRRYAIALACLVPLVHVGTADRVLDEIGVGLDLRQSIDALAVTAVFVLAAISGARRPIGALRDTPDPTAGTAPCTRPPPTRSTR